MIDLGEFRARPLVACPSKDTDLEAKGMPVLGWLFRRQYPLLSLGGTLGVLEAP
jgi:hypothetical protein